MTTALPTSYQKQNLRELSARSPILASSWASGSASGDYGLSEALNLLWSRKCARMGGVIFEGPLATESATYTAANVNDRNLDTFTPSGTCERIDASGEIQFELAAISIESDLRARIYNADSGLLIATVVASSGGTLTLATGTDSAAVADTQTGGGDPALLYAVLDAKTSNDVAEALYGFVLYERVITSAADLPG